MRQEIAPKGASGLPTPGRQTRVRWQSSRNAVTHIDLMVATRAVSQCPMFWLKDSALLNLRAAHGEKRARGEARCRGQDTQQTHVRGGKARRRPRSTLSPGQAQPRVGGRASLWRATADGTYVLRMFTTRAVS